MVFSSVSVAVGVFVAQRFDVLSVHVLRTVSRRQVPFGGWRDERMVVLMLLLMLLLVKCRRMGWGKGTRRLTRLAIRWMGHSAWILIGLRVVVATWLSIWNERRIQS